jgi:hypothetical protein
MNLKELLSYREKCLIHDKKLNAYNLHNFRIYQINLFDTDFLMAFKDKDTGIYIHMMCSICVKQNFNTDQGLSLGHTTLNDIRILQYYYTFWYYTSTQDGHLGIEKIKYPHDEKFYHIDANLVTGKAYCKMGSFKVGTTVDDMLGNLLNLELPQLDMKKINNTNDLMSKLKLYNLFS